MTDIKTQHLTSTTGAQLFLRTCETEENAIGLVQINHGLCEHSGRYEHFMRFLSENGFNSIAHDHRGHGLTKAEKLPLGQFSKRDGARKVIKDVDFVVDWVRAQYPGLPLICFGHSMGGLIATNYAQYKGHKPNALAVWNSNFKARQIAPIAQAVLGFEQFFLGSDVPSPALYKLTFAQWAKSIANAQTDFDWLSHDDEAVRTRIADKLCAWRPSISMWQDVFNLISWGAHPHALQTLRAELPIQIIAGGQDPATDYGKAASWFANALRTNGQRHIDFRTFPSCRHETLNEIANEEAMDYFLHWAKQAINS